MSTQKLPESPSPATPPARPGGRRVVQRSLTEVTPPDKLHRAKQLDDGDSPSTQRMRRSVDVPRSGAATPMVSPDQSRRASLLIPRDGDDKPDSRGAREDKDKERLPGEREQEREKKASSSTDGLRRSLAELSGFSADTARQLDQTHYALLEKTSGLQVMVKALKDLAQASCDLQVGFERTARELETDVTEQLRGIGQFESQQSTIETLQSRIHRGRRTVDELAARVDVVRKRVEGWERADRAWQEKTRKRLRITWAALSILVCVLGLLLTALSYHNNNNNNNPQSAAQDGDSGDLSAWRSATPEAQAHDGVEQSHPTSNKDDGTKAAWAWEAPLAGDEPLRIFDEL
ncbi:septum formation initiator domain-containing [Trichoderma cornu-damae]|uniref:Septum formation initiator domain-containing n=1 Tax=Trichoderma cornu-damae TaxID=654480 RepID=A0A9P8TWR9_9HYPO|nr:septum formation initiator domain-containing [Trichoderma cornu-damae]